MRLSKKKTLPSDTKGERAVTPFGEIHLSARTLGLWLIWEKRGTISLKDIDKIYGAIAFDIVAGLISLGLANEIGKRVGRAARGKPVRLTRRG